MAQSLARCHSHTRPADVLIAVWDRCKPAAFCCHCNVSSLPSHTKEVMQIMCAASTAAETRKLLTNGPKCQEFGWTCIPLAVETFFKWGKEAHLMFSRLAFHLAISMSFTKP